MIHAVLLASSLLLAPAGTQAHTKSCEATRLTANQIKELRNSQVPTFSTGDAQLQRLNAALTKTPDDLDLHLYYQQVTRRRSINERDAMIERYRQLAKAHGDAVPWRYLYAAALVDTDTPQAITIGNQLLEQAPEFPRTHLLLGGIYGFGKFQDRAKAEQEAVAYFDACPGSLNRSAINLTSEIKAPANAEHVSQQLRRRLEGERQPDMLKQWQTVWDLEFKAKPPAQHDAVRTQMAAELARIVKQHPDGDADWYDFLHQAYKISGDAKAAQEAGDKLLARYPQSDPAQRLVTAKWYAAHPRPGNKDKAKLEAYQKAQLDWVNEQLKRSPDDTSYLSTRFSLLSQMDDTSNSDVIAAADAFLSHYEKAQNMMILPPPELQVANVYLKRKIRLDQIPSLAAHAKEDAARLNPPPSDRMSAEEIKMRKRQDDYATLQTADTLAAAALATNNPAIASDVMTKLSTFQTDDKWMRMMKYQAEAKWAEAQGRKLDALLLYRAVMDSRTPDYKPEKDDIADAIGRLRKQLGGTDTTQALWNKGGEKPQVADNSVWSKPGKPLKPWQLSDLQGKTWKLEQLHGKTVLVNLWATWCGPCTAEHPHLQKLYEQLKNRNDVQIVTFNVDEEIGNVKPYLKERGYTFPVLLASDYVNELIPVLSIPRNWIIDAAGQWQWEEIGFGDADSWRKEIIDKLGTGDAAAK